jgi:hypothetical protein
MGNPELPADSVPHERPLPDFSDHASPRQPAGSWAQRSFIPLGRQILDHCQSTPPGIGEMRNALTAKGKRYTKMTKT